RSWHERERRERGRGREPERSSWTWGFSWSSSVEDRTSFQGVQPDGRGSGRSEARLASGRVMVGRMRDGAVARAGAPHASMWTAAALSLGPAVSNGIGRFAYALVLPAMRTDLRWTYTQAGWVNTANALGYLAGSLATLRLLRRARPQRLFAAAMVVTTIAIFASGLSRSYPALLSLRFVA